MKNNIVKARGRHGTSSLDLTLPTKIKNQENISEGDLFKVESKIKEDDFISREEIEMNLFLSSFLEDMD